MGTHIYYDAGARRTDTRTSIDGVVRIPVTSTIELHDGNDHIQLAYSDLDALDEVLHAFEEARANHVIALTEGRTETVRADQLGKDELAILDGDLVLIAYVVLTDDKVIVRYSRKYAGLYDDSGDRSMDFCRSTPVKRILPAPNLAVV